MRDDYKDLETSIPVLEPQKKYFAKTTVVKGNGKARSREAA